VAEARPTRAAAPVRSRVKLSHGMEVEDEDAQLGAHHRGCAIGVSGFVPRECSVTRRSWVMKKNVMEGARRIRPAVWSTAESESRWISC